MRSRPTLPDDPWTHAEAITQDECDQLAKVSGEADDRAVEEYTCRLCAARFTCALAFDGYNTDGDCLAEK